MIVVDKENAIKIAEELVEHWEQQGDDLRAFYYRGIVSGLAFGSAATIFDESELEELF
jgi:hypothetical protein